MGDLGNGAWLFALALVAFVVAVAVGFVRRDRQMKRMQALMGADTVSLPGWTEGETTRLLSSAEQPGFYMLRPRLLGRVETVAYHHIRKALPQHEIMTKVRLLDILQLGSNDESEKRAEAFRRIAYTDVSFVVCDSDMLIIAIIDLDDPSMLHDSHLSRLHQAKRSALQTADVRCVTFDPLHPPSEQELRQKVLNPATLLA